MKKKKLIAVIALILVAVIAVTAVLYQKGVFTKDESDGAEIEIEDGATGFPCSCGCSSGNEMEDCQCEKCAEREAEEEEETTETVCYLNSETGEIEEIDLSDVSITPMDEETVEALEDEIKNTDTFCIRRCESVVYDDGGEEPEFTAESESRYFYDAESNKVLSDDGKDITSKVGFSVSKCKNSLDFLKAYMKSKGMPTDFMTDDTSHVRDLYMNQRVYSFGVDECEEISYLEKKMDGIDITQRDCSYQIKTTEDGEDRITYITVTVSGQDSNGATVVRYVTYILEYNPSISE